jgi:hypothetical protein
MAAKAEVLRVLRTVENPYSPTSENSPQEKVV